MKFFLPVFVCLLLAFPALSQEKTAPLKIERVTGNYFVYTTYQLYKGELVSANGLYVVTPAGVILVDSPWDTSQLQPLMDSIETKHHKKIVLCIATHSHEDRTGCLDELNALGIKTYASEKTDSLCLLNKYERAAFLFRGDTTFTVGGLKMNVFYPGPGHTSDNVVVYFPEAMVLHGGCFIKSTEATDLGNIKDANLTQWPKSIKRLQARFPKIKYVIPGHQDWKNKNSLQHTLKLLAEYKG